MSLNGSSTETERSLRYTKTSEEVAEDIEDSKIIYLTCSGEVAGASALAAKLQYIPGLTTLDLSKNLLTSSGVSDLALACMPSLRILNLKLNGLSGEDIVPITDIDLLI